MINAGDWLRATFAKPGNDSKLSALPTATGLKVASVVLPDVPATIFEGEAEFAVVVGRRASKVKAADAMSYVFGYVNFIDGSARGLPPPGNVLPANSFIVQKSKVA